MISGVSDMFVPLHENGAAIPTMAMSAPGNPKKGFQLLDWTPLPIPPAVEITAAEHRVHSKLGKPTQYWEYRNETDELEGYICRFDVTRPDGTKDKQIRPRRWGQWTAEDGNRRNGWQWKGWGKNRPLYRLREIQARPDATVIVCEGEKAADAAARLFPDMVATTAMHGAKSPHKADWRSLAGRRVIIATDNDAAGTVYGDSVYELVKAAGAIEVLHLHPSRLGAWAFKDGQRVPRVDPLPQSWDVADALDDGWTPEAVAALAAESGFFTAYEPAGRPHQVAEPARPNLNPPIVENTANLVVGSDVEIARHVCSALITAFGQVVYCDGQLWRHIGTHWQPITDPELRRVVHEYDGAIYADDRVVRLGKSRIDSILNEMEAMLAVHGFFAEAPVGINCVSGFISFDKDGIPTLGSHDPAHRSRHVLPSHWPTDINPEIVSGSLLARLLSGSFQGDDDAHAKVDLLAEVAASAALGYGPRLVNPKAAVLVGVTAENGKSQVLDMMRELLPPGAVSSLPLGKFGEDRYVVQLAGKLLNASDELSSAAAIQSDAFKKIITGEPTVGRDVYRSAVSFRPAAQHVFATNDLPSFRGGMDRGVLRRLLVIPFNRTVPREERIEHIGLRIAREEPDLLLDWAVKGATRLIKRRYFAEPESSRTALREWVLGADPVLAWLEERATIVIGSQPEKVKTGDAYTCFSGWALSEGYGEAMLPRINTFVQRLLAAGKGIDRKRDGKGRYLIGLKLDAPGLGSGQGFADHSYNR